MVYEWKNKVVLIAGAATGIGSFVVRYILDEGIKHVAFIDINETAGTALEKELLAKHQKGKLKFYKCDITNEDHLLNIFDTVVKEQGSLDVVINNAGIMNESIQTYRKMILINEMALVTSTLKAIEVMRKDKGGNGGTVINAASIAALIQFPSFPIYSGTKSAVLQFSNCIGSDEYYARTGVRVLTICYGCTETPLIELNNLGNFDPTIEAGFEKEFKKFPRQTAEAAAKGVLDTFKYGESGSTWISTTGRPAKDITATVKKAYALMTAHVFE